MITKIYLDMDGVLSDFNKRFVEIHAIDPEQVRGTFTESHQWDTFVEGGHFETLDWFPGGIELWNHLSCLHIPVEILSSSGGHRFFNKITEQKTNWLRARDIHIPAIIVPGKKHKKKYADSTHLLIDDTPVNVTDFINAGGKGILHRSFEDTLTQLENLL